MAEEEEKEPEALDFSIRPYEEFIAFLFDREVPTPDKYGVSFSPFHDYEFAVEPERPEVYLQYLSRLGRELPALEERYGHEKIKQGLRGLWRQLIYHTFIFGNLLCSSIIPPDERNEAWRSMTLIDTKIKEGMPEALDFTIWPYEDWVKFLFDWKVPPPNEAGGSQSPFYDYEFVTQPERPAADLEYLTRICHELPELVERYGFKRIDQGLWFALDRIRPKPSIGKLLWDSAIPLETRIECIRSMKLVFTDVVAKIPEDVDIGTVFFMWWDLIRIFDEHIKTGKDLKYYGIFITDILPILMLDEPMTLQERHEKIRSIQCNPAARYDIDRWDEKAIEEFLTIKKPILVATFTTLREILEINDHRCQSSALHGLAHLVHPQRAALVQDFIDRHREEFNERDLRWIESCRDGTE